MTFSRHCFYPIIPLGSMLLISLSFAVSSWLLLFVHQNLTNSLHNPLKALGISLLQMLRTQCRTHPPAQFPAVKAIILLLSCCRIFAYLTFSQQSNKRVNKGSIVNKLQLLLAIVTVKL